MKRICLIVILVVFGMMLHAQTKLKAAGIYDHVLDVTTYSDWGKEYLTITDLHVWSVEGSNLLTTFDPVFIEGDTTFSFPYVGDIILELNGESAKNMTPAQFYALTDTATVFSLKFANRIGKEYHITLRVQRNKPSFMEKYSLKNYDLAPISWKNSYSLISKRDQSVFSSISDKKFDFWQARTYDYVIVGNDPLNDENILNYLGKFGLVRDEENPDILFTIAKNADESINHTYVPPTSRTINTGSYTTARYNYLTKVNDYVTQQNYQTVHEGGYTQTTRTASVFLELAALDAKKINDKSMTHAPIVWQVTAKCGGVTDNNFNLNNEYCRLASWGYMPPVDRCWQEHIEVYEPTGLVADNGNTSLVAEVKEGSRAKQAGFMKGDMIIKIESWQNYNHYTITAKKGIQYESIYGHQKGGYNAKNLPMIDCLDNNLVINWGLKPDLLKNNVKVTVLRNKKKIVLQMFPHKENIYHSFWR